MKSSAKSPKPTPAKKQAAKPETTSLAIVAKSSVVPPPRKEEIIEAMARIKREQLIAEKEDLKKTAQAKEVIYKKMLSEVIASVKVSHLKFCSFQEYANPPHLYFKASPEGVKELAAAHADMEDVASRFRKMEIPELSKIKSAIRQQMQQGGGTSGRVQALLAEPTTRDALGKMLTEIA